MNGLTPGDRKTQDYMCELLRYLGRPCGREVADPYVRTLRVPLGVDRYEVTAKAVPRDGRIEVELQIKPSNALAVYEALEADRHAIHAEIGKELIWLREPKGDRCRVATWRDADIEDVDDREQQFEWFKENLERFERVFKERVHSLASIGR